MNEQTQAIFLPCEVITLRAFVAPEQGDTPLDRLVLEAIGKRTSPPTFADLTAMFGLGERPILDLVQRLWSQSMITINPRQQTIGLTDALRRQLETKGDFGSIDTRTMEEERVEVLRELVGGHILRERRFRGERSGFVVPEVLSPSHGRLSIAERAQLGDVVNKMLRRTFASRSRVLIQAIPIVLSEDTMPARTTVQLRARVTRDPASEQLRFEVLQPQRMPASVRASLSRSLTRLAEENPELIVFRNIRRRVSTDAGGEADAAQGALERLAQCGQAVDASNAASAEAIHRECVAAAGQLGDYLRTGGAPERVRVLAGESAFHDAVRDAIRTAKTQILLAAPYAEVDGFLRYRELLAEATQQRGVRVVLVWGIESTDEFTRVTSQLARDASNGSVLRSSRAAKVHAKFVVRDGDLAVVGSTNFFSRSSAASQVGVVVESGVDGATSRLALELLEWGRTRIPEYSVRHAVEVPAVSMPVAPPIAAIPAAPVDGHLDLWRQSWRRYLVAATRAAADHRALPRLVFDQEHRHLLFRAVQEAKGRLLIASDQLAERAFDTRLEQALRARLQEGLQVALLWRRRSDEGPMGNLAARLEALAADFPSHLHMVDANTHAKVLIWDDSAIVTSFNFLSFEGEFEGFRGANLSREAGVFTGAAPVTQAVVEALIRQHPGKLDAWNAAAVPATPAGAPEQAEGDTRTLNATAGLLASLGTVQAEDDRRSLIRAFFHRTPDPAGVLRELLAEHRLNAEDEPFAMLCALRRPELRESPHRPRWLGALASRSWREREFYAAAVFLQSAGHAPEFVADLPSARVVQLAAVTANPEVFTLRLMALVEADDTTGTERDCACGLALSLLIGHGRQDLAEPLKALAGEDGSAGARAARAFYDHWWSKTMAVLPLEAIGKIVRNQKAAHGQAPAREALRAALHHGAKPQFQEFPPGDRTLQFLFGPRGRLQPLTDALERDNPAAARAFLETLDTPDEMVQDAWREAGNGRALQGRIRNSILRSMRSTIDLAWQWADLLPTDVVALAPYDAAALAAFRSDVLALMPALEEAAAGPATGPVFAPLVDLLAPVVQWES